MKINELLKLCVVALGIVLCLQTSTAMASIVTNDQIMPLTQIEADKLKIKSFVERTEVKDSLHSFGVESYMSDARVAVMTDQEVHELAQNIDSMPAGGRLHDSDLVVILLIVLLILLI